MHTSRPIEVQGRFVGVAVTNTTIWRFVATDALLEGLDGATFPSLTDIERVARLTLTGRNGRPAALHGSRAACTVTGEETA